MRRLARLLARAARGSVNAPQRRVRTAPAVGGVVPRPALAQPLLAPMARSSGAFARRPGTPSLSGPSFARPRRDACSEPARLDGSPGCASGRCRAPSRPPSRDGHASRGSAPTLEAFGLAGRASGPQAASRPPAGTPGARAPGLPQGAPGRPAACPRRRRRRRQPASRPRRPDSGPRPRQRGPRPVGSAGRASGRLGQASGGPIQGVGPPETEKL